MALVLPGSGDEPGGTGGSTRPAAERAAAPTRSQVVDALATLQRALGRDRGAVGSHDGAARADGEAVTTVVANAAALGLRDVTVRLAGPVEPGAGAGASATAAVTWRLPGSSPSTSRVTVAVVAPGRVVSVAPGPGAQPLWLAVPLRVRSTPTTLVVAAPGQPVGRYARWAREAVATVRRVLPGRPGRLVLEVPADAAGLDAALGTPPGSSAGIAAVTTTTGGPMRVVVDPDVLATLRPRGAAVVIAHEAVHVATGAAGERRDPGAGVVPAWLREGFADYVALRDVDLPARRTAAQVRALVRRDGLPDELPGPADLAPAAADLGASYEAAWLACRVLAARAGERGLVRVYERVDAGVPWGAALRDATGWGRADLVRAWQDRLHALARGGRAQGA